MKVMVWQCRTCKEIRVSYAREHHVMNCCGCGSSGVDLEYYMCRYMGNPKTIGILDDEDYAPWLELSLGYLKQTGDLDCPHERYIQIQKIRDEINIGLCNGR